MKFQFFPKQSEVYREILNGSASVIGMPGGRGSAKSSCIDRIAITLMLEKKGIRVCIVMRNFDQVLKYHIQIIKQNFPELKDYIKSSMPASMSLKKSRCDFSYAENIDDIERRFRSGNYDYIFVDQAEQFSEQELKEMRKACRAESGKMAKLVLAFNMRGSGIQFLRKWFYTGENESPEDFKYIMFYPWDNVTWVKEALQRDGYTVNDYYAWTDQQRKDYAAKKGYYTKQLATDDDVIRQADWESSWDSIEGTYFANSWDLQSTKINTVQAERLRKAWATHWISQDWGKTHFCVTYWHYRITLSAREVNDILGWELNKPINVIVTYRELILNEMESSEVAQFIVDSTPESERPKIRSYFLSPEEVTEDVNCIGSQQGKILKPKGMPFPVKADNELKGGWSLMGKLMKATKGHGFIRDLNDDWVQQDDVWLISEDCIELLKSIPKLMRDKDNIDIVKKTDKSQARVEMDCADAVRYGLKTMLTPQKKTADDVYHEKMSKATPYEQSMLMYRHEKEKERKAKKKKFSLPPSWKGNIKR